MAKLAQDLVRMRERNGGIDQCWYRRARPAHPARLAGGWPRHHPGAGRKGGPVGLALPAAVRQLERAGVISGYSAIVEQKAAGLPVSVFISIKLERQRAANLDAFGAAISRWPEVMECYLMTGQFDFLLRVVCADLESYEHFLRERLTQLDGVASIESSFSLGAVKFSRVLPL